jgi:Protein of unknown function (DUF2934)
VCLRRYGSINAPHERAPMQNLNSRSLQTLAIQYTRTVGSDSCPLGDRAFRTRSHTFGPLAERGTRARRPAAARVRKFLQLTAPPDFFGWRALISYHRAVCEADEGQPERFQRGALVMNKRASEDVARRAYELFLSRDGQHGHDVDDWLEAERQLRGNGTAPRPSRRTTSNTRATKTPAAARAR